MAKVGSIEYVVSADLSGLLKAEQAVSSSATNIESSLGKIDSTVNRLGATTKKLSETTGKTFRKTAEEAESMGSKTSTSAREVEASLDTAGRAAKELGSSTSKSSSQTSTAFKKTGGDARKLGADIKEASSEATRSLKSTTSSAQQLNTQMTKTAVGVKTATSGVGRFGNVMGQAGFQIQDAVTQISMGTNALSVLGIQGAQLAGAFGPGGAVIGAVIALAGVLGATLVGAASAASEEIDYLTVKVEELGEAQRVVARRAVREQINELKELAKTYENNLRIGGRVGDGITARVILTTKGLEDERAAYERIQQSIKRYQDRLDEINGRGKTQEEQAQKTRGVLADLSGEYRVLALQVLGATEEANRLSDNLTAQALLGEGATKQALQEVVAGLQAIRMEREKLQAQQQAQQEQQQGLSFAESVITRGMTPAERREQEIARLEELRQKDIDNEATYQQAIASLRERQAEDSPIGKLTKSFEQLDKTAGDAIGGIVTKTITATDAIRNFATSIASQAISALVQMGIEQAKTALIGQTTAAAATAATVAQAATSAAAWAPAAAAASLATLGTNAGPAAAALTSTNALASTLALTGGRRHGGPVSAGRMYEVNEGGRPEMLTMGSKQYLMPNANGKVTSNRDMMQSSGVVNNINITMPQGVAAETRTTRNQTGGENIDIIGRFVADMDSGGRSLDAITRNTTAGQRAK